MSRVRWRRRTLLPLHVLLRPLGYLEITDVYAIGLDRLPSLPAVAGYEVAKATGEEIEQIARELKRDEPAGVIRRLSAQGHHCFVAKTSGSIVAYDWIAFSDVQEEEYRCCPSATEAICLNAYTVPEHRGKGLHPRLLLAMLHFARSEGRSTAYTAVSVLNEVSWKTHVRLGWELSYSILYFRPNFIPGRRPWPFSKPRDPVRLDWDSHAWFAARRSA